MIGESVTRLAAVLTGLVTSVRALTAGAERARGLEGVVGATLLILVVSCGVPTDNEVRSIDPADVPSGLIEPPSTTEPQPTLQEGESTPEVYFLGDGNRLVAAPRKLGDRRPPGLLSAVLQELAEGPEPAELDSGLSTALPPELTLELVRLSNGQATVDLIGEQVPASANLTRLAVGQIVLSATSVPSVTSVILTRDGTRIEAPLGNGVLTREPVTAAEYQSLLQPQD